MELACPTLVSHQDEQDLQGWMQGAQGQDISQPSTSPALQGLFLLLLFWFGFLLLSLFLMQSIDSMGVSA